MAGTAATLSGPTDVAVGTNGAFYIADTENHRIRMVDRQGVITTVAGSGIPMSEPYAYPRNDSEVDVGWSIGDGDEARKASLSRPLSIALDKGGNLYISDAGHHRVRRVDAKGVISTIAGGTHNRGTIADGWRSSATDIPAHRAWLEEPSDLLLSESGGLYVAVKRSDRVALIVLPGSRIMPPPRPSNAPSRIPTPAPSALP